MKIGVIIPAAGFSRRYSAGAELERSKLDEDLGGRPVLQRTIELFDKHEAVGFIIVAGPADPQAFASFKARYSDKFAIAGVQLCPGGKTHRYETVKAALAHVPGDCTHIAVHDAARPAAPPALIDRLFDAAERSPAVVPGVEASDTLKRVGEREAAEGDVDPLAAILGADTGEKEPIRFVESTVDRSRLWSIQTPQIFRAELLRRAYSDANTAAAAKAGAITDDAQLVERLGEEVVVIPGDPRNIKITRPADLSLVRAAMGFRDGDGRPVHKRF